MQLTNYRFLIASGIILNFFIKLFYVVFLPKPYAFTAASWPISYSFKLKLRKIGRSFSVLHHC